MNRFLKLSLPRFITISAVVFVLFCLDCRNSDIAGIYTYKIINTFPHDRQAFTEGLVFGNGVLYEGTGLQENSTLRKVELETGNILQMYKLPPEFFGEGITVCGDKIVQLTYKSRVGLVYKKDNLVFLRTFNYSTEGWGITYDGNRLIMSDGTASLYFLSPDTFEVLGRIEVRDQNTTVRGLNELEYVKGEIYANVWPTEHIVRINPKTGRVIGWIYMDGLSSLLNESRDIDVLNGIAYDTVGDRLFVTGKHWPMLFQIELVALK